MGAWTDQIHRKAALVHDQIAAAIAASRNASFDSHSLVAMYQELLDRIYLEELPYAQLVDHSDIVIRADGPATATTEPRVSALTHLLDRLRDESKRLAKVVGGLRDDARVDNIDLYLSGITRGSIIVGLRLALPAVDPRQESLLTEDEPIFMATRSAIRALADIPHLIGPNGIDVGGLSDLLPNPAIRDATLVTAQRLSPSRQSGIRCVELSSPGGGAGELTLEDRKILRRAVAKPMMHQSTRGQFRGVVREVDLDAKRIEIRHVPHIGSIRCIVDQVDATTARSWLDKNVTVKGQFERDSDGKPRLIKAESVVLNKTPRQLRIRVPSKK